jgi:hypothetical protein
VRKLQYVERETEGGRRKKKGGSFYQNILTLRIELPKMPQCSICVKHFMSK